ncbi:MAG: phospholipase D-like domain-containing protein, partial [Candidatus Wallbacteria bacterium]|nr:phospholipase D-like domain-containing protein [Candidatus Wallbacteria bacterium]
SYIDAAESSLDISIYTLDYAPITEAIIRAADRLGSGKVRVAVESSYYYNEKYTSYRDLESAGITIVADDAGGTDRGLCHHKFIIRDKSAVLAGSTNFTIACVNKNNNNVLVIDSPSAVPLFQQEFDQMFTGGKFSTRKSSSGTSSVLDISGIRTEIYFSPYDKPKAVILREIARATTSIVFCMYTFTDSDIAQALIERKNAGVDVRGVYDKLQAGSSYSTYKTLSQAGVPVKLDIHSGFLHDKFVVIDAELTAPVVLTGSYNWTDSANTANDENIVLVQDKTIAEAYFNEFEKNFTAAALEEAEAVSDPVLLLSRVGFDDGAVSWIEAFCIDDSTNGSGADISGFMLEGAHSFGVVPDGTMVRRGGFVVFANLAGPRDPDKDNAHIMVSTGRLGNETVHGRIVLKDSAGLPVDGMELPASAELTGSCVFTRDSLCMDSGRLSDWTLIENGECPDFSLHTNNVIRMTGM